jgi:GDP-4-dehydro-6-deoxy-D-mannose reductase
MVKKFLVTGATAFAGCHLTKLLLREGHQVWATSRRTNGSETDVLDIMDCIEFEKINWVFCDLLNKRSCHEVLQKKYDGIFHLAAQSHPPTGFKLPFYTQDVNVSGTLNLLEAVSLYQPETHFMFCSTSEVYGAPDIKFGDKIHENWPIQTVNPYASSKAMIDIFFQERINNGFLNGFITRAFSHTGPKRGKIFSISSDAYQIARILKGEQEPVILVGNLKSRRAVMDVRDCVSAYYKLMMNKSTGVFNVGADNCHEIGEILNHMINISGLSGRVEKKIHEPFYRPIDIPVQIPDTYKLKKEVDWKCEIPLSTTLQDLLIYWKGKITNV